LPKQYPFGKSVRAAAVEEYPEKAPLLSYFHSVRAETKKRLENLADKEFDRPVQDEHFGDVTVAHIWVGVVTSCAWHSGQIALTSRR
jgi:hypothetical protein